MPDIDKIETQIDYAKNCKGNKSEGRTEFKKKAALKKFLQVKKRPKR